MTPTLSRLPGALRTRRGATIAALAAFALLIAGLSHFSHHGSTTTSRVTSVPLPPAGPSSPSPVVSSLSVSASHSAAASSAAGNPGNDGPGSDNNPASNTGGFAQATITSGEVDPALAAVNWLVRYLNTTNMSPREWRDRVKTDDNNLPLVTSALAAQVDNVDPDRVPTGVIDQYTAHAQPVGDNQVQVTVRLVVDQYHQDQLVATLAITLDGSSHRWLVSQLDETKPGGAT